MDTSGGLEVDGPGAVRAAGFHVLADLGEEVVVGLWVGLRYAPGNVSMSAKHNESNYGYATDEVWCELPGQVWANGFSVLIQIGRSDPVQMIRSVPLDIPITTSRIIQLTIRHTAF